MPETLVKPLEGKHFKGGQTIRRDALGSCTAKYKPIGNDSSWQTWFHYLRKNKKINYVRLLLRRNIITVRPDGRGAITAEQIVTNHTDFITVLYRLE